MDPYEIGWWIESADEDTYGPVSRKNIQRFLQEKTISPNTLIRHCTQAEAKPVADQPEITRGLAFEPSASEIGDRLEDAWPRSGKERQALAANSLKCVWHNKPASLVCVRCRAPYCQKCRARPFKKQFYLCKRCQSSIFNRRVVALIIDSFILVSLPTIIAAVVLLIMGTEEKKAELYINVVSGLCLLLLFFKDSLMGGASIGKRLSGLRVVTSEDGTSPPSIKQGFIRWLSQLIPIYNLVDAQASFSDPLFRRHGDSWAGTRVLDSPRKLVKDRAKVEKRMLKRGIQPARDLDTTMQDLARLV